MRQLDWQSDQCVFGAPCLQPKEGNMLPLILTYLIKNDGTLKARCTCNDSPRMKGTITIGHTHAASLEQSGTRLFWALSVLEV